MARKHNVGVIVSAKDLASGVIKKVSARTVALGVAVGKTTADGLFTLEATRCIGCCGLAPAMMINEEVYGRLTPEQIPAIVEKYRKIG